MRENGGGGGLDQELLPLSGVWLIVKRYVLRGMTHLEVWLTSEHDWWWRCSHCGCDSLWGVTRMEEWLTDVTVWPVSLWGPDSLQEPTHCGMWPTAWLDSLWNMTYRRVWDFMGCVIVTGCDNISWQADPGIHLHRRPPGSQQVSTHPLAGTHTTRLLSRARARTHTHPHPWWGCQMPSGFIHVYLS